jgi:hypothetical protein
MESHFKHQLSEADARTRLRILGEYLDKRHGIKVTWTDDSHATFNGKYMVVRIEGELSMEPGICHFKGKDPGFLWRKRATEYIDGKLKAYLDPATPIDALPRGPA